MRRLLILSVVVLLVAGCAMHKQRTTIVIKPLPPLNLIEPVHAQVAWIELSENAVVVRMDGYRHALSRKPPDRVGPEAIIVNKLVGNQNQKRNDGVDQGN